MNKSTRGKLYLLDSKKTWELKDDLPDISACEHAYYVRLRRVEKLYAEVKDGVGVWNETSNKWNRNMKKWEEQPLAQHLQQQQHQQHQHQQHRQQQQQQQQSQNLQWQVIRISNRVEVGTVNDEHGWNCDDPSKNDSNTISNVDSFVGSTVVSPKVEKDFMDADYISHGGLFAQGSITENLNATTFNASDRASPGKEPPSIVDLQADCLKRTPPSVKRFVCSLCHKQLSSKRSFIRHTFTHTGEKPFQCSVCDYSCTQKVNLDSHLRTHGGVKKVFPCTYCEKSFYQNSHLKVHNRIHTGEKPFSCRECPYACARKDLFDYHMRTHSDERPFSCGVCGKGFFGRSDLTRHQGVHSGEKYICSKCGKEFTRSGNRNVHFKRCNKKDI